jgi:hypothetical protein
MGLPDAYVSFAEKHVNRSTCCLQPIGEILATGIDRYVQHER